MGEKGGADVEEIGSRAGIQTRVLEGGRGTGHGRGVAEQWGDAVGVRGPLWVDPKRIARWASRLHRLRPEAMRFHPVRLVGVEPGKESGSAIEILLVGGRRVRVAGGFDAEDLQRVLAVLEPGTRC